MTSDHGEDLIAGFRTLTATLAAAAGPGGDPAVSGRVGEQQQDFASVAERTPVTLLTGFLGSGKTTVLRRLLTADHGLRITAVVNDLGSVNIDAELLAQAAQPSGRLELSNGCACCAIDDELAEVLRSAADVDPPPDAVVVEASGGADAVVMAAAIEADPTLRLDGIVCVVDALGWADQIAHPVLGKLAARQLQAAHVVLLSKVDLVAPAAVAVVEASIGDTAPGRMVLATSGGEVEPAVVLGAAVLGAALRPTLEPHRSTIHAETVTDLGRIDLERLTTWLESDQHGLLRAKGWFVSDNGLHHELQVVGRRWTIEPTAPRDPTVVLIGEDETTVAAAARTLRSMS